MRAGARRAPARIDVDHDRERAVSRGASTQAQLRRASEIATVLFASGFGWLVEALGLSACVSLRCRFVCSLRPKSQCPHHVAMDRPLPERMRFVLERLGPTFVKAGQMLALRPDYVPLEYAEALRSLHDHVPPFPGDEARRVVERELGAPLASARKPLLVLMVYALAGSAIVALIGLRGSRRSGPNP